MNPSPSSSAQSLNRKTKLALIAFGSSIGVCIGLSLGYLATSILSPRPEGSSFKNTDELRQAISKQASSESIKSTKSGNVALRELLNPHPSDKIIYTLKPKLNVRFQNVVVRTNEHGMRSPSITLEKPVDVYRIALLGDSFAFGWGVKQELIFANLLKPKLEPLLTNKNKRIEVINFGVPGYSTFQEVGHFLEVGAKFKPDIVLVYFVENDFGLPFFIRDYEGKDSLAPVNQLKTLKQNKNFTKKHSKFVNTIDASINMLRLSEFCKDNEIPLTIAINPSKETPEVVRKLWFLKEPSGFKLLPMRESLLKVVKDKSISPKQLVLPKDLHPSQLAHDILADILADNIAPIINKQINSQALAKATKPSPLTTSDPNTIAKTNF